MISQSTITLKLEIGDRKGHGIFMNLQSLRLCCRVGSIFRILQCIAAMIHHQWGPTEWWIMARNGPSWPPYAKRIAKKAISRSLRARRSQIRVQGNLELSIVHRTYPASVKLSSGTGGLNMHRCVLSASIFYKPVTLQVSIGVHSLLHAGVVECDIRE